MVSRGYVYIPFTEPYISIEFSVVEKTMTAGKQGSPRIEKAPLLVLANRGQNANR